MATHHHEIGHRGGLPDQRHARAGASIERRRERVDLQEAVGLGEAGDRAGALGNRKRDGLAGIPGDEGDEDEFLAPELEATRTGTSASTTRAACGGSPARARITGATKAWKVKIAEVGNPGSTTSGLPATTARQSGLPGLSATPCTRISPSFATMRWERSPAPLDVPPESTTMSQARAPRASPARAPPRHRQRRRTAPARRPLPPPRRR